MQSTGKLNRWCIALLLSTTFALGCERKPEDLEKWRNAVGGTEKFQEWALSKKESTAVRARAVQLLIEKNESNAIPEILDKVKEPEAKQAMVDAAVESTEKLWAEQDFPRMNDELKKQLAEGTKFKPSKAVQGVETAFYLHPYTEGENQQKLEAILGEWLSEDHELRRQLSSRLTLEQMLPRAGQKGFDGLLAWFKESQNPSTIADNIRQYGDDEVKKKFAQVILERAMAEHPDINPQLRVIIERTEDPTIVPYLEKAMDDPRTPGPIADAMMDTYIRIKGPTATAKLGELVEKRKDVMRSVAFTRLIEVRGEAGVTQAANALPLEVEAYNTQGDNTLEKDAPYLCNIIQTELEKTHKVKDPKPVVKKMLESSRWPAQAVAIHCAEQFKWSDWKPAIDELSSSQQVVPGWGEDGTTLGDIAKQASANL